MIKKGEAHLSKCKNPKCSVAINVDGNHKVNRIKCFFSNVQMNNVDEMSNID